MSARVAVVLALLASLCGPVWAETPAPLHVRASVAFAPVLSPALSAFTRQSGIPVTLDVGEPDPPSGADLLVGDDEEMGRLLEGGVADVATAVDLGRLPWVLVAPKDAPREARAAALAAPEGITLLGGAAGRVARRSLQGVPAARVRVTSDREALGRARVALVPVSLAPEGGAHQVSQVHALMATAAVVAEGRRVADARRLLAFLQTPAAGRVLSRYLLPVFADDTSSVRAGGYAVAVMDSWEPACSTAGNAYNNPGEVTGAPNAVNLGGKDNYAGMMSLGQAGYVVVDMGIVVPDSLGPDLRVYQATSHEPVTVYASSSASGPWTLIGLRVDCGERSKGLFSMHCDFDLADGGLSGARYFKVEDGEIYPCLAAGTVSEGADIDAVQALN